MGQDTTNFDNTLRVWAYAGALIVLSTTKLLGGSWIGFVAGLIIVHFTYKLLRGNFSTNRFTRACLAILRSAQNWPRPIRFACGFLLVVADVALDIHLNGFSLGRGFNIYLVPIFFSSLLFGSEVTVATWVFSLLAVFYFDIPPRYSLSIAGVKEIVDLLIFIILAGIIFVVPKLLIASATLANEKRK
jgi:K+-sensing histidine kinase KdpD